MVANYAGRGTQLSLLLYRCLGCRQPRCDWCSGNMEVWLTITLLPPDSFGKQLEESQAARLTNHGTKLSLIGKG